jgi:hypothetical protein
MGFCTSNRAPSPAIDAAAANFSAYRVGPRAAAHRPDDATETVSERTNQDEVSSSLIGAVLAISVGNMLSYIARAS